MSKGISRLTGALALAVLASVFLLAQPLAAQDWLDCDRSVSDSSGLLDIRTIEGAISSDSKIMVRVFDTTGDATLVELVNQVVANCGDPVGGAGGPVGGAGGPVGGAGGPVGGAGDPVGGAGDPVGGAGDPVGGAGDPVNSIVFLSYAVDSQMIDVFVGADVLGSLPPSDYIRTQVLAPSFERGEYNRGFIEAIEMIEVALAETVTAQDAASDPAVNDDTSAVTALEESAGSMSWTLLIIGVLLLLIGVIGVRHVMSSLHLSTKRDELSRVVSSPTMRADRLHQQSRILLNHANRWHGGLTGTTAAVLEELIADLNTRVAKTEEIVGSMRKATPHGIDVATLSELDTVNNSASQLSRALDELDDTIEAISIMIAHMEYLVVILPTKRELLVAETEAGLNAVEELAAEGWEVSAIEVDLTKLCNSLTALDLNQDCLDLAQVSLELEERELELHRLQRMAQTVANRALALGQWAEALKQALSIQASRIDQEKRRFSKSMTTHASYSWEWASDLPDRSLSNLEMAEHQLAEAESYLEGSDLDKATKSLDQVVLKLYQNDVMLDKMDDLIVDLEQAGLETSRILDHSRVLTVQLKSFLNSSVNLDSTVRATASELSKALSTLDEELQQVKPNYLRVAETGERTNGQAELLLAEDESYDDSEAVWRDAERRVAAAERALARAKRSLKWEASGSVDGSALEVLAKTLNELPDDPITCFELADIVVGEALLIQESIIAARRRRIGWVMIGDTGIGLFSGQKLSLRDTHKMFDRSFRSGRLKPECLD